jgi:hypothetical protein
MVLQTSPQRRWDEAALAWYFVAVWGPGFIATKIGLQHAPPFTFLALRSLVAWRRRSPQGPAETVPDLAPRTP